VQRERGTLQSRGVAVARIILVKFQFISLLTRLPWSGSEELWTQTAMVLKENGRDVSASVKWWPEERRSPKLDLLRQQDIPIVF
jgi:hypothetical protein